MKNDTKKKTNTVVNLAKAAHNDTIKLYGLKIKRMIRNPHKPTGKALNMTCINASLLA